MTTKRWAAVCCDMCSKAAPADVDTGKDTARKARQRAKEAGFSQVFREGKQLDLCPQCARQPPPAHERRIAVGHLSPGETR
jgi:hypothetical protein